MRDVFAGLSLETIHKIFRYAVFCNMSVGELRSLLGRIRNHESK